MGNGFPPLGCKAMLDGREVKHTWYQVFHTRQGGGYIRITHVSGTLRLMITSKGCSPQFYDDEEIPKILVEYNRPKLAAEVTALLIRGIK